MAARTRASRVVQETGHAILRYLRAHPDGATKGELARRAPAGGVSEVTIQRALDWLRNDQDAPVTFDRADLRWRLTDPRFTLPLGDPGVDDLVAVMFAGALLEPLADEELAERLRRMIEDMDQRVRQRDGAGSFRPGSITATVSRGAPVDPQVLHTLARAIGKQVVRINYRSPWANTERSHDIEPWQLRIHDSTFYLRAYSRSSAGPRSFRVSQLLSARVVDGLAPTEAIPSPARIWGDRDPAYGIDEDRPDVATIRVRGAVARWVAGDLWHPAQRDEWIQADELLERTVPYASCREFARRLMTLGEGLVSVQPDELRNAVLVHAGALSSHLTPG